MTDTKVNGADILVQNLINRGVTKVFCITGAGNLAIVDAMARSKKMEIIFSHHEQAAVMEAQGYSRISGKVGVALVTTGGGASNTLTGILSAFLDSIPILIISGNESSFHCENENKLRAYGVQGFDSVSAMSGVTKTALRIMDFEDIERNLSQAWDTMISNRKGPAFLDFPMDIQRKFSSAPINERLIPATEDSTELESQLQTGLERMLDDLSNSNRPIIYIGNGCRNSPFLNRLLEFIELNQIPFALSWSAIDLIPTNHPLNIGRIGIYGDRATNIILQQSDFLLTLGTRLAIPQVGYDKSDFARHANKWVVDIDSSECLKFTGPGWNVIHNDVDRIIEFLSNNDLHKLDSQIEAWRLRIRGIWAALPRIDQIGEVPDEHSGSIHSALVVDFLNQNLKSSSITVTDVGAGLLTGHYMIEVREGQRVFTSQGLGEMGFGLPAAIGAYFASPASQLICLNTDGAIMFNLQELQVVKDCSLPLKLFIFNNGGYSMIKISQENLFEGRVIGSSLNTGIGFPDFQGLAALFGMSYLRIQSTTDLNQNLTEVLNNQAAVLIEVIMSPDQKYLPRLATKKNEDGTLISPPLEDLEPAIELGLLENLLGYRAHKSSYLARGLSYEQ